MNEILKAMKERRSVRKYTSNGEHLDSPRERGV